MSILGGNHVVKDGLILYYSTKRKRAISSLGCGGFIGSTEGIKDLSGMGNHGTFVGDIRVYGLNYYTIYALSYSEGSRTPPNREGLTAGYNNITSGKAYDYDRGLNVDVYNNDTQAWLGTSYFNGTRRSGKCYDNYDGAIKVAECAQFVTDYDEIKRRFPNSTYVMGASHASDYKTPDMLDRIVDCGGPASVLNWSTSQRLEWILVGRPGCGVGNAYGWVLENNDPYVAHINAGFPTLKGSSLDLDGATGKIDCGVIDYSSFTGLTVSCWVKANLGTSYKDTLMSSWGPSASSDFCWLLFDSWWENGKLDFLVSSTGTTYTGVRTSSVVPANIWVQITATWTPFAMKIYINGVLDNTNTTSIPASLKDNVYATMVGHDDDNSGRWLNGRIDDMKIYGRAISEAEDLRNFNSLRSHYGV